MVSNELCIECEMDVAEYKGLCFTCEMVGGSDILEEIGEYLKDFSE